MTTPYADLPPRAFWRSAVSDVSFLELRDLYRPKFEVTRKTRVATAGSCFAQHIGTGFKTRGLPFVDVEPPFEGLDPKDHATFGFGMFSGRYGNVYSVRQMLQMMERASGKRTPAEPVWTKDGRAFDPFRPSIEPDGFASVDAMEADRAWHLAQVATIIPAADLFIFTFGLTEGWESRDDGTVFPTCPGTIAGTFDAGRHAFRNFTFGEVMADTEAFIALARRQNPSLKFLLTVSPVPLTATASGDHVLPATVYSKSVLRAVCGELTQRHAFVDYFPSYELVASHPARAAFYQPNLRSVAMAGVDQVMRHFFDAHDLEPLADDPAAPRPRTAEDVACDEEMLETFAR